ncbi:MAG: N-acetyltransferase [Chthoniobacterales bacterium]|nr:N-acetyltransferase [Chthoniobacterales bacterium]
MPASVHIFNQAVPTQMSTAVLEPVTVDERREWFHEHSPDRHPLWVCEMDREIAGWLSIHPFITRCAYRGTVEISIYVREQFQRRGIARALLRQVIERSSALEITAVIGLILGHNAPSLQLFEAHGFDRWGVLPQVARLDGVPRDIVIVGRHTA